MKPSAMKPSIIVLALLSAFAAMPAAADTQQEAVASGELPDIEIKARPLAQKMGTQRITNERILNRPTRNGSISELLRDNLNVQFSNTDGSSSAAGEIAPENVSFHGEKFYNNNWMLDGMSNNDRVNPGANNGAVNSESPDGFSPYELPAGGTQSFWVNSGIIQSVNVYDSNISAKYGEFTGGVVDARLKDPSSDKASGSVEWRGSRDSWAKYHVEDSKFYNANTINRQPQFTKNVYSLNVNQPLSERTALLFSYNRTQSAIPFYHQYMNEWSNQRRLSETYVLKGMYRADSSNQFRLTALYSPHESTYWRPNVRDGYFTNKGGGYRINAEWKHLFENGAVVDTWIGYKHTQNKIENSSNRYISWPNNPRVFPWCSRADCSLAYEGGYGTYETGNRTWTAKQDYRWVPLEWGNSKHTMSFGWQADWAKAWYERDSDAYTYGGTGANILTRSPSVVCQPGDDACVNGQYYFKRRTAYPASDVEVNNSHYAAYWEDKINWNRWEITPGIRIDRDSFLKNTDIAPRFTASYDVFGNQNTQIFGGLNRYYSASMLAYKLREATGAQITENRTDNNSPWVAGTSTTSAGRRYLHRGDLKTPYSDEINLGIQQRWGSSVWTLKWVQRHGRNQFGRETATVNGTTYRVLNNKGRSDSNTVSLEARLAQPWNFKYATVDFSAGINYSRSKSNNDYYDSSLNDTDLDKRIIVNGKLLGPNDTPQTEYSTPWRATASIHTRFPSINLSWSQTLNYTAGYSAWDTSSIVCPGGHPACGSYSGNATEYTRTRYRNNFTLDWHFNWTLPIARDNKLTVNLDVINVLDRVMRTKGNSGSSSNTTYRLGRQYWFGARYSW